MGKEKKESVTEFIRCILLKIDWLKSRLRVRASKISGSNYSQKSPLKQRKNIPNYLTSTGNT